MDMMSEKKDIANLIKLWSNYKLTRILKNAFIFKKNIEKIFK